MRTNWTKSVEVVKPLTEFDKIAEDNKDAFLGRSKGILNSFDLAD